VTRAISANQKDTRIAGVLLILIQLILQSEIIRYHRDKLRIGGLAAVVLDGVAKVAVEGIHVAAVPRDLDGVADGEKIYWFIRSYVPLLLVG